MLSLVKDPSCHTVVKGEGRRLTADDNFSIYDGTGDITTWWNFVDNDRNEFVEVSELPSGTIIYNTESVVWVWHNGKYNISCCEENAGDNSCETILLHVPSPPTFKSTPRPSSIPTEFFTYAKNGPTGSVVKPDEENPVY